MSNLGPRCHDGCRYHGRCIGVDREDAIDFLVKILRLDDGSIFERHTNEELNQLTLDATDVDRGIDHIRYSEGA